MNKKIIVPKGLLNPNETAIIEIPPELEDERSLLVSRKDRAFSPVSASTPKTVTRTTKKTISTSTSTQSGSLGLLNSDIYNRTFPSANYQCPGIMCPINLSRNQPKATPRLVRKTSSKTIIRTSGSRTGQSSLGILGPAYMNSRSSSRNANPCSNPECPEGSFGILESGALDSTRPFNETSLGILGPGYFDSTKTSGSRSLGILGSDYFDSTKSTTGTSLGILGPGYFDSTRPTTDTSLGILGPGYFDSTRPTTDTSLGILGPGFYESTRSIPDESLGILGPGYFASTRTTADGSLGILGPGYFDSTRPSTDTSLGILASGYFDSTRGTTDESLGILGPGYFDSTRETTDKSLGILGPGYFDSTNSAGSQSLGILGPGYFDSTQLSGSLGILGPGYLDSTRSTANESLGLLGSGYFGSTKSSIANSCSRDCPNIRSSSSNKQNTKLIKETNKIIIRKSSPDSSRSKLYKSPRSNVSPSTRSFPQSLPSPCPASMPYKQIVENVVEQSPMYGGGKRIIKKQSVTRIGQPCKLRGTGSEELEQKLNEIEANERRQLGQSLTKYQNARRNFVTNATVQATKSLISKRSKTHQSFDDCSC